MAKFNVSRQRTSPAPTAASPGDFGAGQARQVAGAGNVLAEFGDRIARREESLDRILSTRNFESFAQEGLTALESTGDIRNSATYDKYSEGLQAQIEAVVGEHGGRGTSVAALRNTLENQKSQYLKGAKASQIKAQHKMVNDEVQLQHNVLASQVAQAPDQLDNGLAQVDDQLAELGDVLTPTQQTQYSNAGKSTLITGAVVAFLDEKEYGLAGEILANPEYTKYLPASTTRKFAMSIAVGERAELKEVEATNNIIARIEAASDRPLTPEQRVIAQNLPEKKSQYTLADTIALTEMVTGEPMDPQAVARLAKTAPGTEGERRRQSLANDADKFANGVMSSEDARMYQINMAKEYAPIRVTNPVTGQTEIREVAKPQFLTDALAQGGAHYDTRELAGVLGAPKGEPEQEPLVEDPSADVEHAPDFTGTLYGEAASLTGLSTLVQGAQEKDPTGVLSTANSQKVTRLKKKAQFARESITNALRPINEGKIANQYREELRDIADVLGGTFDNAQSYQARLIEINDRLSTVVTQAQATALDQSAPAQERRDAHTLVGAVLRTLEQIPVPPLVTSKEELQKLPPGAMARTPSGKHVYNRLVNVLGNEDAGE